MDSAWAVVIGAGIAFVGSVIGSLLTPLVQTAVERRRAREDREEQEDRRRFAALGPLLSDWVEAAQDATVAIVTNEKPMEALNRLSSASHGILLELRTEDEDLIPAISAVMARLTDPAVTALEMEPRAGLASDALAALSAWRRGSITAKHSADRIATACTAYDRTLSELRHR